jgi:hypothetical protein
MLTFATLGPGGSNHELVTRRYLAFHGLRDARIDLVLDFDDAFDRLRLRQVDFIVQVAVHPETATVVGRHFREFFIVDAFVSPSRPLAVVTRRAVGTPTSIGLQPATREYVDLSRWATIVDEISIASVAEALFAGRVDSGITAAEYAEKHPSELRIDEFIGSPDDAWIVYGRERLSGGGMLAWRESPAGRLYRSSAELSPSPVAPGLL